MSVKGKPKLTLQQRALVRNLAKGMSISQAAIKAGYSPNSPSQSGTQALENIRLKMPELMDKAGLTDEALIEDYLRPALKATETEFAKHEGRITDEREVIAWQPRLTALDMAFSLRGAYPKKDGEPTTKLNILINNIAVTSE